MTAVMRNPLHNNHFFGFLVLSIALHLVFIISIKNKLQTNAQFAVKQAPNSIAISIVKLPPEPKEIPKPKPKIEKKVITPPKKEKPPEVKTIHTEKHPEPIKNIIVEEVVPPEPEPPPPPPEQPPVEQTIITEESLGAVVEAKPLKHINLAPTYPSKAKRRRWEGLVVLNVLVNTSGRVDDIRIEQSSGYQLLDQTALKTVQKWQFEPGQTKNGRSTTSQIFIPIRFELR